MIERFLTEYMIINHNLCRTIYNINDELKCSKNNDKIYKKQEIKKEYNKEQNNPYNYL
jgi:hypothetical protein